MNLTPISTAPEDAKVVSLKAAREKFRAGKCQHNKIEVDEDLAEVTCSDCGAKLNAISVLMRFATEETRWSRQAADAREAIRALDARVRCKCQHCGQMTRIRV